MNWKLIFAASSATFLVMASFSSAGDPTPTPRPVGSTSSPLNIADDELSGRSAGGDEVRVVTSEELEDTTTGLKYVLGTFFAEGGPIPVEETPEIPVLSLQALADRAKSSLSSGGTWESLTIEERDAMAAIYPEDALSVGGYDALKRIPEDKLTPELLGSMVGENPQEVWGAMTENQKNSYASTNALDSLTWGGVDALARVAPDNLTVEVVDAAAGIVDGDVWDALTGDQQEAYANNHSEDAVDLGGTDALELIRPENLTPSLTAGHVNVGGNWSPIYISGGSINTSNHFSSSGSWWGWSTTLQVVRVTDDIQTAEVVGWAWVRAITNSGRLQGYNYGGGLAPGVQGVSVTSGSTAVDFTGSNLHVIRPQ